MCEVDEEVEKLEEEEKAKEREYYAMVGDIKKYLTFNQKKWDKDFNTAYKAESRKFVMVNGDKFYKVAEFEEAYQSGAYNVSSEKYDKIIEKLIKIENDRHKSNRLKEIKEFIEQIYANQYLRDLYEIYLRDKNKK